MASAKNVIADWTADQGERFVLFGQAKGLVLRWLNEAQLRFAAKSEILRGVWEPDLDSEGKADLPDDFLREVPDRVKWDTYTTLSKAVYADILQDADNLGSTDYYAIHDGQFYVFQAASGTPSVPYIKKPLEIDHEELDSAELDIPSEYHHNLILFLEAMYQMRKGDVVMYRQLLGEFDRAARDAGLIANGRVDGVRVMRTGSL